MSYRDVYIAEKTMERRVQENLQEAEQRHMVRELQAGRARWFIRLACKLGCWLAARLITAGKTLERASLRPVSPVESS